MSVLLRSLMTRMRRMAACQGGNVAMMFGVLSLPVLFFVAVGIDYGRALNAQTALQAAIDSTALMVAPNSKNMTAAQLQSSADQYLKAMLPASFSNSVSVTATSSGSSAAPTITVSASTSVASSFTALMGYSNLPVKAAATVKASSGARQRVALVLDNSGSMSSSGKMTALKSAATSFLTQLQSNITTSADVYVSIIPFTAQVNVGSSNSNASWVDWTDYDNDCKGGNAWGGGWGWGWGHCNTSASAHASTWTGCVSDRGNSNGPSNSNYDTNVTAPASNNTASMFSADNPNSGCPPEITTLSNDFTALTSAITSLAPSGNTNQGIGIAHGWMSLVGGGPYPTPPAEDPLYTYQKTMIILSDGLNTENRWFNNASQIDARQAMTCANAKAAGITIYAIQVNTGNDPTSSVLQTCASDSSKFYLLTSSSQILNVFTQISGQLNQLRLSN